MTRDSHPVSTSPDLRDDVLKLWVVLSRAHHSIGEHARRDIERHGLSPSEFGVLELLLHKGPTPIQQVGQRVLLTSGSMTYVVDNLAKSGLVTREQQPTDRRCVHAVLTRKGRKMIESIFSQHADALVQAMSGLSATELRRATQLLRKLGLYAAGVRDERRETRGRTLE